ncbi:hypothetical protein CB1_002263001, partial [Camelus ferus]
MTGFGKMAPQHSAEKYAVRPRAMRSPVMLVRKVSEWKAMFVAFSSSDETTKICLPQCFICKIEFDETNAIITFTICDRLNGKSFQQTIKGIETLEGTYAIDCDCKNKVKITQLSKNVLLVTAVCVDTDGNITIVVELLDDCRKEVQITQLSEDVLVVTVFGVDNNGKQIILVELLDDGTIELQIIQVSEDVVIIIIVKRANSIVVASDVSVDKQVKETILVGVFAKLCDITSEELEKIKKVLKEEGIPEDNLEQVFCVEDCLKYTTVEVVDTTNYDCIKELQTIQLSDDVLIVIIVKVDAAGNESKVLEVLDVCLIKEDAAKTN